MYIIVELRNRAETIDTIIYYATADYETAQELLLSLFDDMYHKEISWFYNHVPDIDLDYDKFTKWCIDKMNNFHIVRVPFVG